MTKNKVLLVHNEYQNQGGEDVAFAQERALLERNGHPVAIYWRSNHEIEGLTTLGRLALPGRALWAQDSWREFSRILEREKPAVVHVHNTFLMISPSIYSACEEANVPVVQTLHNYRLACPAANFFRDGKVCEECLEFGPWRGFWHRCYRGSYAASAGSALLLAVHRRLRTWSDLVSGFIALSEFARQKFISAGLPPERVHVKPNFVETDPGPGGTRLGYAVSVGRLSPEKGLHTLLAAWAQVEPSIVLQIVGDGPMRRELEAEAQRRQLSNVVFRGRLHRAAATETIRQAKLLVHPSECYENFPMAIAEAFACATPVLCSRLGSMQEIVTEGETGLLFEPGDPADLAAKLRWMWNCPQLLSQMGRRGRQEYQTRYSAPENYARLMAIYGAVSQTSERTVAARDGQ